MARWSPEAASLILMSHTLTRETTGTYARTLASKASLACATGANRLAAIAKAARQHFIGDMLQITEQQAAAGLGSRWPTAHTGAATRLRNVQPKNGLSNLLREFLGRPSSAHLDLDHGSAAAAPRHSDEHQNCSTSSPFPKCGIALMTGSRLASGHSRCWRRHHRCPKPSSSVAVMRLSRKRRRTGGFGMAGRGRSGAGGGWHVGGPGPVPPPWAA